MEYAPIDRKKSAAVVRWLALFGKSRGLDSGVKVPTGGAGAGRSRRSCYSFVVTGARRF